MTTFESLGLLLLEEEEVAIGAVADSAVVLVFVSLEALLVLLVPVGFSWVLSIAALSFSLLNALVMSPALANLPRANRALANCFVSLFICLTNS